MTVECMVLEIFISNNFKYILKQFLGIAHTYILLCDGCIMYIENTQKYINWISNLHCFDHI